MLAISLRSVGALLLVVGPLSAQGFKLNPQLASAPGMGGDIESFTVTADGTRVVYVGDQDSDDVIELYSARADGTGAPVVLSAMTLSNSGVETYLVSADGTRVAYFANQDVINVFHLYGAPVDGSSPPVELVGADGSGFFRITPDGRVVYRSSGSLLQVRPADASTPAITLGGPYEGFQIFMELTADGTRCVYQARTGGAPRLFSVPTDGSAAPTMLASSFGDGSPFEISPDGSYVVFLYQDTVRSVPIGGGAVVQLSGTPVGGAHLAEFAIDPTSARVLYRSPELTLGVFELFSAPIDGSQPAVRLNPSLVSNGDVQATFGASLDGTLAFYLADQELDERVELYSVPIDGGAAVKLNPPLVLGGTVHAAEVAADGVRVVYRAEQDVVGRIELYGVPLDGSASATKLSGSMTPGAAGVSAMTLGASDVLYVADQEVAGRFELYRTPYDGSSSAVRLSGTMTPAGDVSTFPLLPAEAGGRAFYLADQKLDEYVEVFSAPLDASAPARALNDPLTHGTVIGNVYVGAIARSTPPRYVYLADQNVFGMNELFSTSIDGAPRHVRLSPPDLAGVDSFSVSSDGARVAYLLIESNGVRHVYSVPSDASQAPVRLSGPMVSGGNVGVPAGPLAYAISPDGTRVVYRADQDIDEMQELFSAPIDGSAPAVKLNGSLPANSDVREEFRISADGTHVLYRADQTTFGVAELWCAPIDGSQPAIALTPGVNVSQWYEFSPDGSSVVYVDVPGQRELYRVASTGGASVKLNGTLVAGGNVRHVSGTARPFAISADSSRVAYLADQNADEVYELFSAPIDGSASAVRISPPLSAARDVMSFRIAPDSSRAVFVSDVVNDVFELFSVPLDGSAAALKLNGTMPTGGDISGFNDLEPPFLVTNDGARVVYRSDEQLNNRQDLFAVPIDASAPPLRINQTFPAGGIESGFELTEDGRNVVYLGGDLFSAPIDGSGPERVLQGPGQVPYAGIGFRFEVAPRQVIFLAQEVPFVRELFLSFLPRPHRSPPTPTRSVTRGAGF